MAFQTGLEGKPWWYGLLVGLIAGAVGAGLVYWQVIQPKYDEIASQEARLAELQEKILQGRAAQAKLPQFREEVRRLELELDKLLRILPARRNTPELIRRIRLLAERGDFSLLQFKPGNPVDREFYAEWPIFISLQGTYHNLALFFDRVSRLPRIINIDNLKVSALARAGSEYTISATFTAKTFIYKETEPKPAAPAAGR